MTEIYRTTELDSARINLATARYVWATANEKGQKVKARRAAEAIEFWGNKVAFLNAVKGE